MLGWGMGVGGAYNPATMRRRRLTGGIDGPRFGGGHATASERSSVWRR
jgi:hypothetical protein